MQDQLLTMARHLLKISQHRQTYRKAQKNIDLYETCGKMELTLVLPKVKTHSAVLEAEPSKDSQVCKEFTR